MSYKLVIVESPAKAKRSKNTSRASAKSQRLWDMLSIYPRAS